MVWESGFAEDGVDVGGDVGVAVDVEAAVCVE
jgi:hypothetical protein